MSCVTKVSQLLPSTELRDHLGKNCRGFCAPRNSELQQEPIHFMLLEVANLDQTQSANFAMLFSYVVTPNSSASFYSYLIESDRKYLETHDFHKYFK